MVSRARRMTTIPLGVQIEGRLRFDVLTDLLHEANIPAIRSTDGRAPLSHSRLRAFIRSNNLASFGISKSSRVGILLAEGPELGSCLVTVMASCCAVPINYHLTEAEVVLELTTLGACSVILSHPKESLIELLIESDITPILLTPDEDTCGLFQLHQLSSDGTVLPSQNGHMNSINFRTSIPLQLSRNGRTNRASYDKNSVGVTNEGSMAAHRTSRMYQSSNNQTGPDDYAMILRTSGTSGNKKTVPYTLKALAVGAICVAQTWGLQRGVDINLNMMPLYHVGGIVRNLLAPLLSGSTVIITTGFDAGAFWDILQTQSPTWYYAVPTMHMAILDEGQSIIKQGNRSGNGRDATGMETTIRMIANAGGGLPHSLAVRLREMFHEATVLPSYGMTECMPIASPPLTYNLEKPGTSGIAVGPEIAIKDDDGKTLPSNKFGRISVRGPPVFKGYEGNDDATKEAFTKDGFFDTGDMGYLDEDGYLFITGRSKEVINRGGEIVSPVEVEDAVLRHPKVQTAIAFSVPHDVLQETIGIVVVPKENMSRVGLGELQKFLAPLLHPSKWPQLIVYMNDLPKNQTGKPLRIKLAERMKIGEIDDSMTALERSYDAVCPPIGTPLTVPIEAVRVPPMDSYVLQIILSNMLPNVPIFVAPYNSQPLVFIEHNLLSDSIVRKQLSNQVHDYEIPQHIIMLHSLPRTSFGDIDGSRCMKLFLQSQQEALTGTELFVVSTFEKVLGLKSTPKSSDDFFEIGGNSLTAGKVMALIRGEYGCKMSPMTLFKNRTAKAMAATIDSNVSANEIKKKPDSLPRSQSTFTRRPPQSQSPTRFLALLVQAMPILFFKPIPIISYWIIFAHFMTWYSMIPFFDAASGKRGTIEGSLSMLAHLVLSGMGAGAVTSLVFPFIGVLAKWVVIGRYHAGSYPLWGQYYLRWWLVDQLLLIFDAGIFRSSDKLFCIYLRMMGAQVVDLSSKIDSKTVIREFDLIQIYPNCAISKSIVRGFTVDAGLMILKPVRLGRGCIINQQSTIAPGAILPPRTILPPRSSSHELEDSSAKHRIFAYNGGPSPSLPFLLFIGYPTVGFVKLIGALPWLACMYWLVQFPFFSDPSDPTFLSVSMFGQFLLHQAQDYRIGIHILRVAVNAAICPFFKMAATILVKKAVIGRFQPGQKTSSQWQTTRHWIMYQLLGSGELCGLYNLLGRHYSAISSLYRMLGAKIGMRVYWPGTPMPFYEFDLLDIGDDVVFGSRSQLVFTDNIESRPIMIGPGAMIADRCVILPGVVVGKNAMIGSGSLLYKNGKFAAGSTWIGSKAGSAMLWDEGDRKAALRASTVKPFGKAFYFRDASYRVYSQFSIIFTNILFAIFSRISWNMVPLLGVVGSGLFYQRVETTRDEMVITDAIGHGVFLGSAFAAYYVVAFLSLLIGVSAKWIVMGRRVPGSYDWDKSSYCQRWQLYITLQSMQSGLLGAIRGSHYLVAYFRGLGCKIGERVCLYPTGGDPMMTEPDLITIGSHTVIDQASVVAHINSRGNFDLNELKIGESCVLRTDSRLLSGAEMEDGSKLLEHTLIVGGEVVDAGRMMQGWPAKEVDMEEPERGRQGTMRRKVTVPERIIARS